MSAFGYDVPEGYTIKSLSVADVRAGMLALIKINSKVGFDLVESATPFVRPCPCPKIHDDTKTMEVFYKGSNWHKSYPLTDKITVAVPA